MAAFDFHKILHAKALKELNTQTSKLVVESSCRIFDEWGLQV